MFCEEHVRKDSVFQSSISLLEVFEYFHISQSDDGENTSIINSPALPTSVVSVLINSYSGLASRVVILIERFCQYDEM